MEILVIVIAWLLSALVGFWIDRHPIHGRHIL
jgi:hypothetical protein